MSPAVAGEYARIAEAAVMVATFGRGMPPEPAKKVRGTALADDHPLRAVPGLRQEVSRVLKRHGSKRRGTEGTESGKWVVQDFGDVVIHVFAEDARGLYDLEHLWGDAPRVEWSELVDQFVEEDDAA